MFHALCETCADAFIGVPHQDRCERAWRQTYRAINHGFAKNACVKCVSPHYNFPQEIQDFAALFMSMQELRHKADYDPFASFTKADTITAISSAKSAIEDLNKAGARHKAAFAVIMLLGDRKN